MYLLVSVLVLIVCVFMILIVLVQNSKGGGLASNFSSSNQVMGVRKTTDFLEKATWTLAVALIVLALAASMSIPRGGEVQRSRIEEQVNDAIDPTQMSTFPTAVPETITEEEETTEE